MRVRGITFDLDGTLADTLPVCYAAFREVFRAYLGREYADDEIHALFGPCEKGLIRKLIPDWQPPFAMFLSEYESAHRLCPGPFPGVVDLLDWLHEESVPVAIVTGKGSESAAISLRLLGLADQFEIVEAGDPEGAAKSVSIARILETWNLPPESVAHIGDAPGDLRAAHATGVTPLAAAWASTARRAELEAERPAAVFESVPEFHAWLQQ